MKDYQVLRYHVNLTLTCTLLHRKAHVEGDNLLPIYLKIAHITFGIGSYKNYKQSRARNKETIKYIETLRLNLPQ